ncbi:hypothetical protein BC941DRAFT_465481 [Chlamydoabsidia padenii]|nr:hypothetical protein BC941DRAFT_465481 [Chlamydoabsidia padenii]
MIITPLEVFVDIHSYLDSNKTKDSTQLLSVEQDASSTSYLVVKDIAYDPNFDNMASTRLPYSDCQYVKANEPAHTDRLEQLARDTLQGYNSAGIFINSRGNNFDDNWRDMTYIVLEQLAYQLNNKNKQYAEDGVPLIKMEYGFIGFYDEHCYDYLNKRAIKNDEAIQLYLHSLLQPVDKIGDVFDLIGSTPRLQPTLLVFHLTNHNKFESTFAWVDLLPPSTPDTQRSYNNCYSEFVNITKEYTKSKRNEFMPTTNYPMTHFLLDYFSGSYQTMAFAHFEASH